jgi:hypothetical protein
MRRQGLFSYQRQYRQKLVADLKIVRSEVERIAASLQQMILRTGIKGVPREADYESELQAVFSRRSGAAKNLACVFTCKPSRDLRAETCVRIKVRQMLEPQRRYTAELMEELEKLRLLERE